jgi:RNA polymerase sigma-70 factor (ECF subfamily)
MEVRLLEMGRRSAVERTTTVAADEPVMSDRATAVFVGARPRLFEIAYRILGSASEAEDVVQEAWLRWQRTDRSVVLVPTAFLARTTTRLALHVAQSARRRRETYTDPGFPEPADPTIGPEARTERGEAVEQAVLLLLQNLTPTQRAAYVLREAFDYPYKQIAEILHLRAANTRQLVRRSHKNITAERRRPVNSTAHRRLARAFLSAAQTGNLAVLEQLLMSDASADTVMPKRRGGVAAGVVQAD